MNILVLAAGHSASNSSRKTDPIWLHEVDGTLVLERQVKAFEALNPASFVFLFQRDDIRDYYLQDIVEQIAPASSVIEVRHDTAGAACTALLASGAILGADELVVASATDQIDVDFAAVVAKFREQRVDAGVLIFDALHPRYSFVALNDDGFVVESSEKRPISRNASTGFYWFARGQDFFDGAKEMILKDAHVDGRFYICPVLNELILKQKKIAAYRLSNDQYHPLKSEKHIADFERDLFEGSA